MNTSTRRKTLELLVALTAVIIGSQLIMPAEGISCYQCVYWEGEPISEDACIQDEPDSGYQANCTVRALTLDLRSSRDKTRGIGDWVCLKLSGVDDNGKKVLLRGCGIAVVDCDLDGHCEQIREDLDFGGPAPIKAGAKQFACTSDNCNRGSGEGDCNASCVLGSEPIVH